MEFDEMAGRNSNSDVRNDFDREDIASVYESIQSEWPHEVRHALAESLDQNPSPGDGHRFLLDVGCGGGKLTKVLENDFDHVLGIDISESMLKMAEKNVTNPKVKFQLVYDDKLPVESSSTVAVTCGISFHYLNTPVFLAECDRILVEGGILACFVFGPNIISSLQGTPIANYSAESSRWQHIYREFQINCGMDEVVRETHLTRYEAIYNALTNPTKHWRQIAKRDVKYTIKKMLDYMSSIAGYRTKTYLDPTKDPLNVFRESLIAIFRDAGLECNDDTEFKVTFEYSAMVIKKTKHFGIA